LTYLVLKLTSSHLNYAGSTELFNKIVFTLNLIKVSTFAFFGDAFASSLCCLAFFSSLFSFQGAILRIIPSKLDNVRGRPEKD